MANVPSVPEPPFVYGPMMPGGGGPPIAPTIQPGVFRFGEAQQAEASTTEQVFSGEQTEEEEEPV